MFYQHALVKAQQNWPAFVHCSALQNLQSFTCVSLLKKKWPSKWSKHNCITHLGQRIKYLLAKFLPLLFGSPEYQYLFAIGSPLKNKTDKNLVLVQSLLHLHIIK